jgi:tetratricopeptide (TPR) repeat protein
VSIADEIAGGNEGDFVTRHFMEGYCRDMRGRIRLARNEIEGALEDAAEALDQARVSNEPQMLYPALAFRARALAAAGDHDEAARVTDELLTEWTSKRSQFPASSWVVDLAYALELLGREGELTEAESREVGASAWLDAAVAFCRGEFEIASELFARIGSRPDEAYARLRAAEKRAEANIDADTADLDLARSFFRDVGAGVYLVRTDDVPVARRAQL